MLGAHDMTTTIMAIKQELGCETEITTATNTIKDNFQESRAPRSCKSWDVVATNDAQITATHGMLSAHDMKTTIMAIKHELGCETEITMAANTIKDNFQESRVSQSCESWGVVSLNDSQISDLSSMKPGNEEAIDVNSKIFEDSNEVLANSEQTHEKYFICDICNKRYQHKNFLRRHISQSHGQKYLKCDFCPQKFAKMNKRHIHIKRVHLEKEFECELCGKKFACEQYLDRHIKSHENERLRFLTEISDKVTIFKCETCQKDFYDDYILKRHQAHHNRKLKKQELLRCDICIKDFKTIYRLTHHMQFHQQASFDCDICKKKFTSKDNVRRHIQHGHPIEYTFICEKCPKRYKTIDNLNRHMLKHNSLKDEEKYVCVMCRKQYKLKRNLKRHMLKHNSLKYEDIADNKVQGETVFQCDMCDKEYTTKPHLRRHFLATHIGDEDERNSKKPACKYCGKKFLQKSDLKVHERIHTGEKPYACGECTRTFTSNSSLRHHERTAHH